MNFCSGRRPSLLWRPFTPVMPPIPAVWPTPGFRPVEASKGAVCYIYFTSTPALLRMSTFVRSSSFETIALTDCPKARSLGNRCKAVYERLCLARDIRRQWSERQCRRRSRLLATRAGVSGLSENRFRSIRLYRRAYFADHRYTIWRPRPETCQTRPLGPPSRQQNAEPASARAALSTRSQTSPGRR
jgi:hypothetical protein